MKPGLKVGLKAALTATSGGLAMAAVLALSPAVAAAQAGTERAIFAGGCFWCTESDFDKVPGVVATISGYTGGTTTSPTYQQVSSETTGHAEAVEVIFDPKKVSYAQLVEHYWRTVDPTTKDRQFCDIGSSYRTAIFAVGDEQLKVARASKEALAKSKPFSKPIVTEIVPASTFYKAEEYHQDYYIKNPVRYRYYRTSCGRDARLKELWGSAAVAK